MSALLKDWTQRHPGFARLWSSTLCRRDVPPTSAREAIGWWESRRIPFNLIVGSAGILSCIIVGIVGLGSEILFGSEFGLPDPPLFALIGIRMCVTTERAGSDKLVRLTHTAKSCSFSIDTPGVRCLWSLASLLPSSCLQRVCVAHAGLVHQFLKPPSISDRLADFRDQFLGNVNRKPFTAAAAV
jgi:hypothetical protein